MTLLALTMMVAVAAQPPGPCDGYDRAKALLRAGDTAQARALFEACLATEPDEVTAWRMLLGIALSREFEDRPIEAVEHYRRFVTRSATATVDEWLQRRTKAREDIDRLEGKILLTHAIVDVQSTPAGASVVIAGTSERRTTPARLYLAPGVVAMRLSADGYQAYTSELQLRKGERHRLEATLQKLAPTPKVLPSPAEASLWEPWVLIGSGAAAVIAGGVLTGLAAGDANEYNDIAPSTATDPVARQRALFLADRVGDYEIAMGTLYAVGGAAVLAGIIWLVIPTSGEAKEQTQVVPDLGGVRLRGTF